MMKKPFPQSNPAVVCLHASTSSSRQWRVLAETLEEMPYRMIAPDLYGYGQGPTPSQRFSIEDEVDWVLEHLDPWEPFHLVGHSYGGGVALKVAQRVPARILSLTLFEPAAFGYLKTTETAAFSQIFNMASDVKRMVDSGNSTNAAVRFIDYWNGERAFEQMPDPLKKAVVNGMTKVRLEWDVIFGATSDLAELIPLRMPTLLLSGTGSTQAAQAVAHLLHHSLSDSHLVLLEGLEHMGPVTHPSVVNAYILHFLNWATLNEQRAHVVY